ncbi:MAG: hypothetical protein ACXV3F_08080, partial [Frankiaceae bacterium]
QLKEREPRYQKLAARVARQQASVQSEPTAGLAAGASPDDRDSGEGTRLTKDGGKRPAPRPAVVAGTAAKAAPAGGARAGGTSRDGAATPRPAAAESHDRAPEPKGEDGAAAARPARQPARSPQRKSGRPGRPSGKRR